MSGPQLHPRSPDSTAELWAVPEPLLLLRLGTQKHMLTFTTSGTAASRPCSSALGSVSPSASSSPSSSSSAACGPQLSASDSVPAGPGRSVTA
jgi:hypothetical protein